jgi:hypothetical protein
VIGLQSVCSASLLRVSLEFSDGLRWLLTNDMLIRSGLSVLSSALAQRA